MVYEKAVSPRKYALIIRKIERASSWAFTRNLKIIRPSFFSKNFRVKTCYYRSVQVELIQSTDDCLLCNNVALSERNYSARYYVYLFNAIKDKSCDSPI